jgi:hypothetical protein
VQDGEVYDEEDDLGSDEEEYEYDEEEAIDKSREEDGASTTRGTSGFFFSDPVSDSPASSLRGPQLKHIRGARRSFGLNHFNFTPTPERPAFEETPATASLAQSPTSHIYHGPTRGETESTPLLSATAAVTTPQKLVFEETFAPDSVASRRASTIGRGRLAGPAGRRMSTDRRSVRSRRSIAVERGESTDGQTVSLLLSLVDPADGSAVQLRRRPRRYRNPIHASCSPLHGLDTRHMCSRRLWRPHMPYVSCLEHTVGVQADFLQSKASRQAHSSRSRHERLHRSGQEGIRSMGWWSHHTFVHLVFR